MTPKEAADVGLSGIGMVYNIFSGERNRRDYLSQQGFQNELATRQQNFHEHTTLNAAQIRRADMEAAGFHPTLAMGTLPHTSQASMPTGGSAGQPRSLDVNVLAALRQLEHMKANIDHTRADTDRIKMDSLLARRRFDEIELPSHGFNAGRFQMTRSLHPYELAARKAGVDEATARAASAQAEQAYIARHGMKMPTRRPELEELSKLFRRALQDLGADRSTLHDFGGRIHRHLHGPTNQEIPQRFKPYIPQTKREMRSRGLR